MGKGELALDDSTPTILIDEQSILGRVEELAVEISTDYADKGDVVLIGVLKGSFIFLADLSRRLSIPRTVDFIAVSSYGDSSLSTGAVRMLMDVRTPLEGRHVILVEDIVDTGHTIAYLMGVMASHNAASVKTCTFLHKPSRSEVEVPLDYVGFTIPDEWVVGYGLDYAERGRTLPYIGIVKPDDG